MKKKVYLIFTSVVLVMFQIVPFLSLSKITIAQESNKTSQEKLKNQDVLEMIKMGLSETIIITKIKSSASEFDTSTKALQELKTVGVSDAIILAMVQSGTVNNTSDAIPTTTNVEAVDTKVKIPDATTVEIELVNNISSEEVKEGDFVQFKVVKDVEINGVVAIKKDASARGRIVMAKKAGRWGKQGKVDWAMNDVISIDGKTVPVRFTQAARGESKGNTVAVAAVATTVLLGPIGLLWGLKKGKPAIIPAGNRYTVYVDGEASVNINGATKQ